MLFYCTVRYHLHGFSESASSVVFSNLTMCTNLSFNLSTRHFAFLGLIWAQKAKKGLGFVTSDERISWYGPKRISKYIWLPNNLPNKYPSIFGCHIFAKQVYKYIHTLEMAQIQIRILFEGHFIWIFEYSYSSLIAVTLEKDSLMLSYE